MDFLAYSIGFSTYHVSIARGKTEIIEKLCAIESY